MLERKSKMRPTKRPWIAFFSLSGTELLNIIKETGFIPDVICTNNPKWHDTELGKEYPRIIDFRTKWTSMTYFDALTVQSSPIITLHGWLRIIPSDVCFYYEIYNGHPALVNRYPELKGKNMQEVVINEVGRYPIIGSIIHKVVAEVDAGEILKSIEVPNFKVHNREVIYNVLRDTSLRTWLDFLPTIL
jgi:hypothetical protein